MELLNYNCITASGKGVPAFMSGLYNGEDFSAALVGNEWNQTIAPGGRVCFLQDQALRERNFRHVFASGFFEMWQKALPEISDEVEKNFKTSRLLIVLSSTKGVVEDFIWKSPKDAPSEWRKLSDPFGPVLNDFEKQVRPLFSQVETLVVSNACASSHVAFETAKNFLDEDVFDYVIVLAADLIGPFIYKGFTALKILSRTQNQPFSATRDGLQLGEALAFFFLTNKKSNSKNLQILSVKSETEGGSVTRPSMNGDSLLRVLNHLYHQTEKRPDFFIAHGTGTVFNDAAEELAIRSFCQQKKLEGHILGTKWSIGHTLGASGAVDLIAACEVIKNKKTFRIKNTLQVDPGFTAPIHTLNDSPIKNELKTAMVSSLGFGGVHAALLVEGRN